ncbi:hypothetical protein ADICYQ_0949 [Cyclobacterium qasimii M12-11B]|uniref:Uncharacterized protein n=2 Tax=Cyclobacterium qasimii TaxID=1350429 RepID=S7VJZ2_9BACT|nr:hypothetical protein ADICYQ_0949 [Cyclobacterium qasimii M12-11B]GEO22288.1 hypothetical protein CQA01_28220 [Cyclobacterium qasimii]
MNTISEIDLEDSKVNLFYLLNPLEAQNLYNFIEFKSPISVFPDDQKYLNL